MGLGLLLLVRWSWEIQVGGLVVGIFVFLVGGLSISSLIWDFGIYGDSGFVVIIV